jgi:hypothetical protein
MLDADLAPLYGVPTRALIQAVRRSPERFPADFMFRLETVEAAALRSQTVISNVGRGGRRYLPYAFTEQGVAMLSSVLRSQRAIRVNVEIMRAVVRLRRMLVSHDELAQKVATLERRYDGHAIRKPMAPPVGQHGTIGFRPAHRGSGPLTSRRSGRR